MSWFKCQLVFNISFIMNSEKSKENCKQPAVLQFNSKIVWMAYYWKCWNYRHKTEILSDFLKKKLRVETSPLFNIDRAITYRWYRRCALHGTVQVFQLYKKGSVTADKCELAQRLIMPKAWRCYRNGMPEKLVCVKTHVTCI